MSDHLTRRSFIEAAALGAVAATVTPQSFAADDAKMAIAEYKNPQEDADAIKEEAIKLTEAAAKAVGGMGRFVSKGDVVLVKPNIGWDRKPEHAADTNPDVVATIVKLCYEAGADKVRVGDYTCHDARRAYVRSGIQEAAEKAGAEVFFFDDRKFKEMDLGGENLKKWPIYTEYVECDRRINVPIAKHHRLAEMTVAIKNLMGITGDPRNRLHQNLGPAMADVTKFLHQPGDLIIVDTVRVLLRNGPVGGNLKDVERRDTVAAGIDPVAMDAFASTLFGHPKDYLGTTKSAVKLGIGTADFETLNPVRLKV